jgi:hypothetical protein
MPKRGPNKRVTYLFDYFDYNLFGIKLVNALTCENKINTQSVANKSGDINSNPNKHRGNGFLGIEFRCHSLCEVLLDSDKMQSK